MHTFWPPTTPVQHPAPRPTPNIPIVTFQGSKETFLSVCCWFRYTRLEVTVPWWTRATPDQSTPMISIFSPHHSHHIVHSTRPPHAACQQCQGARRPLLPGGGGPLFQKDLWRVAVPEDRSSTWVKSVIRWTTSWMWSELWRQNHKSTGSLSTWFSATITVSEVPTTLTVWILTSYGRSSHCCAPDRSWFSISTSFYQTDTAYACSISLRTW